MQKVPPKYKRRNTRNLLQYFLLHAQNIFAVYSKYDDAFSFSEGLAEVKLNGKWGFIDKKGNFVVKPQYADCTSFMKPSQSLVKMELKRPSHNIILKYLYSMFKKVYVPKYMFVLSRVFSSFINQNVQVT